MLRKILIGVVVLILAVAAAFIWFIARFRSQPMATLETMSRVSLRFYGADRHEIDGPGGRLVYFTAGEGPTVVLIHGVGDQAGLWGRTVARLKDDYRFVILDLPGHGESAPSTGPLDFPMMLEAIDRVAKVESGGERVALAGNSLGGWLAALYATEHPERVRALVLENAGGLSWQYTGPSLLPKTRAEARELFNATIVRTPIPDYIVDDFVRRVPASPAARMAGADFGRWLLDARLASLSMPVSLIWGESDKVTPLDYARKMQGAIPGSTLKTIPRCGHIPHNECPDEFAAALREALAR